MRRSTARRTLFKVLVGMAVLAMVLANATEASAAWIVAASAGTSKTYNYSVGGGEISQLDSSSFAWRASGGYTFLPYLGVVASFMDLGKISASGPAYGGFTDTIKARGEDFSLLGILPIGKQFGLLASIGMLVWQQDVDYSDESGDYTYNDRGVSLSYGFGANYYVGPTRTLGIHIEWQRAKVGDANNSGHRYTRDFFSAGVTYRFGR